MNPFRGWEIGPEIMYDMGIRMRDEYGNMPWFISESGMGVENEQRYRDESGIIQDDYRIDFIKEHLDCAIRAAKEGCNCQGYMLWAFTDNVSPRNAFKNRYGLVEIDLEHNRDRHLKKSAFFYKQTIEQQSFDLEDRQRRIPVNSGAAMLSTLRKAGKDGRKHGSTEKEKAKDYLLSGDSAGYHGTAAAHPENARRADAPDPNDPHVFTRYKKITYPFVVLFPPYALYRIWCKKTEFNQREKYVQTAVCVLILFYFIAFRLNWF